MLRQVRTGFLSRAALVILGLSCVAGGSAIAQNAPTSDAGGVAQTSSSAGIEEVIVTARRTSENAQRVPISLTVLSGSDIEVRGVSNLVGLAAEAPSVI